MGIIRRKLIHARIKLNNCNTISLVKLAIRSKWLVMFDSK